jgi:acetyl esterase/lipase
MVYAHRLRDAGVPVEVEAVKGAFHAFDLIASNTSVSRRFFASQCKALRSALADSPAPTAHDSDGQP